MKKMLIFIAGLIAAFSVSLWGNHVKTTDYFQISGSVLDSAGEAEQHAESVHVMTYFKGYECIDAWYVAADDQCQTINGELMFYDQYADIDADSGDGCYYLRYAFIDSNGTLYHKGNHYFTLGYQDANIAQISGDGTVADNLEEILDGDATGADMRIDSLRGNTFVVSSAGTAVLFEATGGDGTGLRVLGEGSGSGFYSKGGATGHGHYSSGGVTSGHGVYFYSADGIGAYYYALDGQAIKAYSYDTTAVEYESGGNSGFGHGLSMVGGGTGKDIDAAQIDSILESTGHAAVSVHTKLGSFLGGAGSDVFTLIDTLRKIAANCTLHVDDLNDLSEEDIWTYEIDAFADDDSVKMAGYYLAIMDTAAVYWFDPSVDTLSYVAEVTEPVIPSDTTKTGDTLAVKPDSLVYQGPGAGASTIRDAVWSKDTTNTDTIGVLKWMDDNLATGSGQDSASTDHIVALALAAYKVATMPSSGAWSSADSIGYQNLRAIIAAKLDSIYLSLGTIDTSSEATVHEKLGAYDGTAGHGNIEDELDTALTHLGGTGPYVCSLYIKNSDDDYLESANVTIRNSGGGSNYFRRTSPAGLATLNLTTGIWYAIVKHTTNQQVNTYDTITIAGAAKSDTISMTAVSVGTGFCRVYADLYDYSGGAAIQGVKLTAEPNRSGWRRTADGYIFLRRAYTALTDASGYVYMDLPRSSVFTSDRSKSLKYTFSLTKGGGYSDERIPNYTVPDSTTHRILFYKE